MKSFVSLLLGVFVFTSWAQTCDIIYVTPTGTGVGTQADPTSLTYALSISTPGTTLRLGTGVYNINNAISLIDSITIEGGFMVAASWTKTSLAGATTINRTGNNPQGPALASWIVAISGNSVSGFRLQDLTITTINGYNPVMSTYAVHLENCANYNIVRCQLLPGDAANGENGVNGLDGYNGSNGSTGGNGSCNGNYTCCFGSESAPGGYGGAGAQGAQGGGAGGAQNSSTIQNNPGFAGTGRNGGGGGAGGKGGGFSGGNAAEQGNNGGASASAPTNTGRGTAGASGDPGGDGGDGADGLDGINGANGANGSVGVHGPSFWMIGSPGTDGQHGTGGAGGAGGGGGGRQSCSICDNGPGNGGSGGGGGGQGGLAGTAGTPGGSSFALYLVNNGANGNVIQSNLSAGAFGAGGIGGIGGAGGAGGNGGPRVTTCSSEIGEGGRGGNGGNGGAGGDGGNGQAGISMDIYNPGTPLVISELSFNLTAQAVIEITSETCQHQNLTFNNTALPTGAGVASWDFDVNTNFASPGIGSDNPQVAQYSGSGRFSIEENGELYEDFVFIIPSDTANAGVDQTLCDKPSANLSAILTGGSTGVWTTNGGANIVDPSNPNSTVNTLDPGINEFVWTVTGCCGISRDTMLIDNLVPTQHSSGAFSAGFSLNPPNGCEIPHTVFFTDNSNFPDTWNWSFGDGNTSTAQNPIHTYTSTGGFEVILTITDTVQCYFDSDTATVNVSTPVADFTSSNAFGCGPLTTNFTDASIAIGSATITAWSWDFGDGNTSTVQNPSNIYQNPGVYTVVLTVTLSNGCTATETKTAHVQVIGPDVDFVADVTSGCPPLVVNFTDNTVFGSPIIGWNWDFGDGNTSSLQNPSNTFTTYDTSDVSLTVTDIDGCSRTYSINNYINTLDNTAPTITCPGNQNESFDANCEFVLPDYTSLASASDNCTVTVSQSPSVGTVISTNQTITLTATDGAGNAVSCTFDVIPVDNENPVISCPGNIAQGNDAGQCGAVITYITPVGTDNCSGATTSQTAGLPSGSLFPIGTTTNTYLVTDGAGNTAMCSFDVTITDTENPSLACPSNITQSNDPGDCSAIVTYTAPVGTDNCAGATTTQTAGLPSGAAFPVGTTTNTFVVTDAVGNSNTCSFDVIVNDTEIPSISCLGNINQSSDPGSCGTIVTYATPVGTDNCPGSTTSQTAGLSSGATFPIGTTTNTFIVTDAAGNTNTCSFDVVVTDNEMPVLTCPGNVSQNNDPGQCGAIINYTTPVGTDNCTGVNTSQTAGLPSGSLFPIGITTNTFITTDASGNSTTCSFDVEVIDNEAPVINCPTDIATCDSIINFNDPTTNDNCIGHSFTLDSGLPSGSTFPVGTTTNTYTVTDANGNVATCSFTITRFALPTIDAGADVSIDAGFNHQIDANSNNVQTFNWSPAFSLDDPSIEDPVASPNQTTVYTVMVTSPDGCTANDEITISVNQQIEVNNFMSPNGDGKNDTWIIKGHYLILDCTVQVMDSWGNVILEQTGYDNDWDGTKNGVELPDGNYYYVIVCDGDEPITGSITLIR